MKNTNLLGVLALCAAAGFMPGAAEGGPLSIYDIQYTTAADGASPLEGSTVDCAGGVVTHTWVGGSIRVFLQDPARSDWAGIQVRDWTGGQLANNVATGDSVSLTNVRVDEWNGNTVLRYHSDLQSSFTVVSSGNSAPAPVVVAPSAIAAAVEGPSGQWYVADRTAEKYEHMLLTVEAVTVAEMDMGKAADNYTLRDPVGGDCWASDYMNVDLGAEDYHPYIKLGADFDSVSGLLEQYAKPTAGWDYYQLLTLQTSDLVPEPCGLGLMLAGAASLGRRRRREFR